ncbi:hypothetical protein R1flu_015965 [Riccia fluitans]|uniref:Uncharacterized protein n=1 Tax=Riccia fluitans TaxID=41844 RepID=A0ABD1YKG7_9MARC
MEGSLTFIIPVARTTSRATRASTGGKEVWFAVLRSFRRFALETCHWGFARDKQTLTEVLLARKDLRLSSKLVFSGLFVLIAGAVDRSIDQNFGVIGGSSVEGGVTRGFD